MRILHLISQSPDFTGSGKFIQQLICQSNAKGHKNFLLAGAQADFKISEALIEKDHCLFVRFDGRDLGYPIPGMSDVMPYQSTVFSTLCDADMDVYKQVFKQKIQEAVARFKPDILHTHHLWVLSALVREIAPDLPMVTHCHGTCLRQHHLCPKIFGQIIQDLQKVDHIIALSNEQKIRIVDTIHVEPTRIHVISGGFDPSCFYDEPKSFDKIVELVYAGKLSDAKGLPWLLKSLKKLGDLPFRLHIAGSSTGREKQTCLSFARDLGDKCVYHGLLSHQHLGNLMRKAHIFILPSFFEGLPLVLMEALACGCRIIATALPGVKEIFAGHDTDMIQLLELPVLEAIDRPFNKDEPDLERRLAAMIEHGISQVSISPQPDSAKIKQITDPYTWEKIFSKIEKIYQSAV